MFMQFEEISNIKARLNWNLRYNSPCQDGIIDVIQTLNGCRRFTLPPWPQQPLDLSICPISFFLMEKMETQTVVGDSIFGQMTSMWVNFGLSLVDDSNLGIEGLSPIPLSLISIR
ncbi:hypothetical protein L1887_35121 [Cichorium endivia]|nr:hypothetical protein L1887_35121 [Cichorium endivia]